METEILSEQEENAEKADLSTEEKDELIDAVKEKHNSVLKKEKFSDIFAVQLILCLMIVLAFVVINIFDDTVTAWFIEKFKKLSMYETEELFREAVNYIEGMIK